METYSLTYRESLKASMDLIAADPLARFVGYGLKRGRMQGSLASAREEAIVETTVAENLMTGIAHGLALCGLHPVLVYERADFLACGLSAISNHLDCAKLISRGEFNPCVIIRVVVGNRTKPLFTGPTHTQNPAAAMRAMLRMPVYEVRTPDEVAAAYERASMEQREGIGSSMIFEFKDLL